MFIDSKIDTFAQGIRDSSRADLYGVETIFNCSAS